MKFSGVGVWRQKWIERSRKSKDDFLVFPEGTGGSDLT